MSISIIIPAWNEEALIAQTLQNIIKASEGLPITEIIVVDNNSSDATANIAKQNGATIVFEKHNQISKARNTGAEYAIGQYLFFIDADTLPSAEILNAGFECLKNNSICVGAVVSFDQNIDYTGKFLALLWNKISCKFKLAAGSFLLCCSEDFKKVGGFPLKVYAGEEILLSKKLKQLGLQTSRNFTILQDKHIITSSRKFNNLGYLSCLLQTVIILIFPFVLRSRKFCWLWYQR